MPLGRVFQLRTVLMHPNQAGVQLLNFFDLQDVLTDPSATWINSKPQLMMNWKASTSVLLPAMLVQFHSGTFFKFAVSPKWALQN